MFWARISFDSLINDKTFIIINFDGDIAKTFDATKVKLFQLVNTLSSLSHPISSLIILNWNRMHFLQFSSLYQIYIKWFTVNWSAQHKGNADMDSWASHRCSARDMRTLLYVLSRTQNTIIFGSTSYFMLVDHGWEICHGSHGLCNFYIFGTHMNDP